MIQLLKDLWHFREMRKLVAEQSDLIADMRQQIDFLRAQPSWREIAQPIDLPADLIKGIEEQILSDLRPMLEPTYWKLLKDAAKDIGQKRQNGASPHFLAGYDARVGVYHIEVELPRVGTTIKVFRV